MYHRLLVPFLGIAAGVGLGVALASGPVAVADTGTSPIDVWPYADAAGAVNTLPGFTDYESGPGGTVIYDHAGNPPTPWYTVDLSGSGSHSHEVVQSILDPNFAGAPSVGTVADQYAVNTLLYNPTYPTEYNLYSNYYVSDPNLGSGDYTSWFDSSFTNFYVSDTAGIEDQVSFFGGQPITLFVFPASDAGSSGAAASESGDGFQQLMTDLIGAAPGPETLADLF